MLSCESTPMLETCTSEISFSGGNPQWASDYMHARYYSPHLARFLSPDPKMQTRRAMKDNHCFHFAVYRSAGSSVLLENIEQIWLRVGPSVNQLLAEEFARDETALIKGFGHHQKLIRALRTRDMPGALGAITGDISVSTDYLLDALRRQTDSSSTTLGIMNSGQVFGNAVK